MIGEVHAMAIAREAAERPDPPLKCGREGPSPTIITRTSGRQVARIVNASAR